MAKGLDPILKQDPSMEVIARVILDVQRKSHRYTSEVFRDWVSLCVHALKRDDEEYLKIVDRYDKNREILDLFCKGFAELGIRGTQKDYYDILGPVYMGIASSDKGRMGQYFTPKDLARLMSEVNIGDRPLEEGRLTTFLEPCSGSGVMILSACAVVSERHGPEALHRCHFTLVDLDYVCAYMSALQLAAYNVPNWVVYHGNFLGSSKNWNPIMWRGVHPKPEERPADEEPVETVPDITISGEQINLF